MAFNTVRINKLTALHDYVIVSNMAFTERTTIGGIVLRSDDMKTEGVRPRWGQVYAIGPDQKDVTVGQWVLVAHGRWTRGVKIEDPSGNEVTIRRVDNNDIILVSDEKPHDDTIGFSDPV